MTSPSIRPSHQNPHFRDTERQIADLVGGGSRPSARACDKAGQNEPNPLTQKDLRLSIISDMFPLSCQVKTPFDLKSQFVAATFTATNSGKGEIMGSIFKKTTTRHKLDGRTVKAGTPGAVKVSEIAKKWYGQFTDQDGKTRTKSLSTDKQISRQMLAKLEKQVDRQKAGLATSFDDHLQHPLIKHLQNYLDDMRAKSRVAQHIASESSKVSRILTGCRFHRIRDFKAERVMPWINEQRENNPQFGVRTANHHIRAIKGFALWLVAHGRMPHNPFAGLKRINPSTEAARHKRRSLNPSDLQHLLTTTKMSCRTDTGDDWEFTPHDRYMLYQTAVFTGLRARELSTASAH